MALKSSVKDPGFKKAAKLACLVRAPGKLSPAAEQLAIMILNFSRLHFSTQRAP
jgi:hypothetical protein